MEFNAAWKLTPDHKTQIETFVNSVAESVEGKTPILKASIIVQAIELVETMKELTGEQKKNIVLQIVAATSKHVPGVDESVGDLIDILVQFAQTTLLGKKSLRGCCFKR